MAISDALARFAKDTALNTGAPGDFNIGDVIPLGADHNLHDVDMLYLVASVSTTATSGGSATLSLSLITSDTDDLASADVMLTTPVYAVADLVKGKGIIIVAIPKASASKAFLGLRQTTGGAAFTAGNIDAYLTCVPPNYRAFADALTAGQ